MKINLRRSLACGLLLLATTAGLLRADRAADLRNERIPPGHKMHPPLHLAIVPDGVSGPTGYTPQQLRRAYGIDQLGTTGAGQVIAIVDAYGSFSAQADLDTFSAAFNIPSTALRIFFPQGFPPGDSDWAGETSLDVQWAHAIAPSATLCLVVAKSSDTTDLLAAVDYAASLPGVSQVSMSWGGPEYSTEYTSDFHFNVPGVTFFASSGDNGAGVSYPAASPDVVGVGGTSLFLDSSGNYVSESAWYDVDTMKGGGGGVSIYEPAPSYQSGWWSGRAVPDVALDADPATGVPVYLSGNGWGQFGGTSLSAPAWAGLCAIANSMAPQSLNSAPAIFYSLANANYAGYYHDITSGCNPLYCADAGYDLITGLGTPVANQLLVALAGGFSPQAAAPVFYPGAGSYAGTQNVIILSATPGASIRYTTDGSTPTETHGVPYSAPIPVSAAATLKAVAYESGLADSAVTSASYTFLPQAAAPTFSLAAGTYTIEQVMTISTATGGASIRYTVDGSTPTETYGTLYTGPVALTLPATVQAIAYKSGMIDSSLAATNYTINSLSLLYSLSDVANGGVKCDAALLLATDGNFYGTTNEGGGSAFDGTVFKMTPAGSLTSLASFNGTNGAHPVAALVQGGDGNFYGTTVDGGSGGDGVVFMMTPAGVLTDLVSFNGANGAHPEAALVPGSDGNFYGTTWGGGSASDGTAFKMTRAGILTTLVSFNGANGANPDAELVQGSDGNFYGTTANGGSANYGTIFKLTPAGILTTLVTFNGPNGAYPYASLTLGRDGNFYGLTDSGGSTYVSTNDLGNGTAFKMTYAGVFTTLVSFDGISVVNPDVSLVQGTDGNFYSTDVNGGAYSYGAGNVFRMTPEGAVTVLSWFDGDDGVNPVARLAQGANGNFYGTTDSGGANDWGAIFEQLLPPSVAAPAFSPGAGTYTGAQNVTISTAASGAAIRYTTDGSIPTEVTGTLYSGPVTISGSATLKAIAYKVGYTDSSLTSGTYAQSVPVSPGTGFYNAPIASSQTAAFTASFDASPSISPINAVVGLSSGSQTAYAGISCLARFNTSGQIDAYNGASGYQAANAIPYSKGLTYHFRMVVNPPANVYSVYVTPPGQSEILVGSNFGFRKSVTSLNTWTIDVNSSPGGTLTVSNLAIVENQVAAPTFSPAAGTYTSTQSVTISCATSGASVRFTTDGSTPTETVGTLYSNPVSIGTITTLKAIAYKAGMTDSLINSGAYTLQAVTPTFSPIAGTYTSVQMVAVSTATSGASIRYTTDGSTPTETAGFLYSGPVPIGATTTLSAIAYKGGLMDSAVTSGLYTINLPFQVAAPTFSPAAGTYTSAQTVTISTATSGASIRFTTDGSTPTETHGAIYSGAIVLNKVTTLEAIAYESGMADSYVMSGLYTISTQSQVAKPVCSPTAGVYTGALSVALTTTTPGATIRYTTDGSIPSEGAGTIYSSPIPIASSTPVIAVAYEPGMIDSAVAYNFFGISPLTANILYRFTSAFSNPYAGVVQGSDGNFYGVTTSGGSNADGTVYKMTPAGVATVLASFAGAGLSYPDAPLLQGSDGNFYGTTESGGSSDDGTVFEVTSAGVMTTLASFNGNNGADPQAGLIQGTDGNFYGTTHDGGSAGYGTVFKLTPAGALTTLVSFTGYNGAAPAAALVQGSDGNFYGTTAIGGSGTYGTVFKVTPAGVMTPLVSFNGDNGAFPAAALVLASDGNFYGTTEGDDVYFFGTVFKLTPAGALTTLISFNGYSEDAPGTLLQGRDGNFYGLTKGGNSPPTIFEMTSTGMWSDLATLADPSFNNPEGLIQASDGNLYGVSQGMSSPNLGAVFELVLAPQAAPPTFSPPAGTYSNVQTVTITSTTSGVSIRYTTDGSIPSETAGALYSGPVSISTTGLTLKAISYKAGLLDSFVNTGVYTLQAAAPTFTPPAGTYTSAQAVTITSTTSGASIRYTTDGSTPSETAGTLYSGPVTISSTMTLEAIAYEAGFADSPITNGPYTIALPQVAAPTFSPPAGTYTSAQTVTITSTTSGASIRYTTDGSTPSETAGTLYSSPVSISVMTTLKAMAFKSGMTDSPVTTGVYTINTVTRSLTGTSSDGWHALALTSAQAGIFTATFDATPTVSPENAVVGLSKGVATAYTGLSCIARFNTSGQIDAYNGTAYGTSTISYAKNITYHFRMVVNVPAHTYSVYVTPAGGTELTVGLNYVFRVAQASLDTWDLDVNATPSGCSLTANNLNP
ncbi:MAG TPA: choice-of-anchor tandem repeat GloVer-containing protein [Opitutaceae bacterium]|nr:choice-of-anchor tandem repeat GloVer-containing protein [Opitutaceae bacterium]